MKHRFQFRLKIGSFLGLMAIFLVSLMVFGAMASGQASTPTPMTSGTPTASPTTSQSISIQIIVDGSGYMGKTINMNPNDNLVVNLPSNAATGFSWQLIQISDPAILLNTGNSYIAASTPLPGAPGNESWTFKAQKSGTTSILMQYSQPWAGGIKGAQNIAITVSIASNTTPSASARQITVDGSSYIYKPVKIVAGSTLVVSLPSNASTGFSWQLIQISDPSVLQNIGDVYTTANEPTPIPGSPGNEAWTFITLNPGTTGIIMQYSQPWVGGIKGAQAVAVTMDVSPVETTLPGSSVSPSATPGPATINGSDYIENPVKVSANSNLVINLSSNGSTGFSWQLVQISDPSVVQNINNTYNAPTTPLPGAAGSESWTFKALKSGTTSILMQYSQPWTRGIKGAQSIAITVLVQ